ncbi:L-2-amino-thiazoline-4-carboxylic acid hydrolase [Pectinatus sottacetonis]|uniref:L-2-amino-thiazoline-4-carboxylic acid hydrolase n=1 Tax=Pectinatus sottacetonis TaxID=1002795 RepID=UPI0018C4F9FB|nr:L-2-amino-thiazoline-4-carboxylic acid hydrolase [Pectinatus sottacetonis]
MINNKTSIKGDPMADLQRSAIAHRAIWTGLTYVKAKETGKANEVEKIIREAIAQTGKMQGNEIKKQCTNPDSVKCFADTFLTGSTLKTFEVEFKVKNNDKMEMEFHHCPLLKGWQDAGIDDETCVKLCDMAMDGDRNIAKSMGYDFKLTDTIANGYPTCKIAFSKKK